MHRFRQWKWLLSIVVATLLSAATTSSLLPALELAAAQVVLTAPEHQHQDSCCPSAVCDVGCMTNGSCDMNLLVAQLAVDATREQSVAAVSSPGLVGSSASVLLDSPPPRG